MENQEKGKSSVKTIFASYFTILMILYAFFDDGGLAAKSGYDFLFMPVPSFVFAAIFTLVTCLFIYIVRFLNEKTLR